MKTSDSSRAHFIPKRWRSRLQPLSSGHVNSPSQKCHNRRIARYVFFFTVQDSLGSYSLLPGYHRIDEALRNPPEPDLLQPLLNPYGQSCASSPDHYIVRKKR